MCGKDHKINEEIWHAALPLTGNLFALALLWDSVNF